VSAAASQLAPGHLLGRYRIVSPIMEGGMAALYLARPEPADPSLPSLVAVKTMREHLARDAGFVTMFEDEGRLIARLARGAHPNLLRFFELGRSPLGAPFLAIEYVDGVSLVQLMQFLARSQRALAPAIAVHIALGVAKALHVAHELRGDHGEPLEVIHRDVSPQNVLLSTAGDVKLIDFGVAKSRGRQWQTAQGSLKGKLGYMSPEQARAEVIDRRSDVYALGVVLWEILVGHRLFAGAPEFLLERVQRPHIASPRSLAPGLSPALEEAVLRALAPDRDDRFESAAALEAALAAASPESAGERSAMPRVLGRLVCAALAREVEDDVEEQRRSSRATRRELVAPRLADLDVEGALSQHTRVLPPPSSPPSARPSGPAPRPASPVRPWMLVLAALLAVPAAGAGAWWTLSRLAPPPAPTAPASAPPPAALSAPAASLDLAPPPSIEPPPIASPPGAATPEGTAPETAGSSTEEARSEEAEGSADPAHRRRRERPAPGVIDPWEPANGSIAPSSGAAVGGGRRGVVPPPPFVGSSPDRRDARAPVSPPPPVGLPPGARTPTAAPVAPGTRPPSPAPTRRPPGAPPPPPPVSGAPLNGR
jgi:serine/threonine protein kinase